jgi:hypothetical protein
MPISSQPKNWRDVLPIHPAAELFPLMSEPELRELGEDIKAHGLVQAVHLYKGKLLDGRNRLDAMELISGSVDPRSVAHNLDDAVDPYAYVIAANIHRRHLTVKQQRELIAKLIKQTPDKSDRQIATQTKTSPTTVGKIRKEAEAAGDVSKLDTRTDTKGRKQPSAKPKKASKPVSHRPESVSAKDVALADFTSRSMELIRLTWNRGAERFAKTALSYEQIKHLAELFIGLGNIRLADEAASSTSVKDASEAFDQIMGDLGIPPSRVPS